MGCQRVSTLLVLLACTLAGLSAATSVEDMFEAASLLSTPTDADFVPLSLIELEEHEDTPTPPFSVCKYLLEASAQRVKKGDHWPLVAKHIANVRQSLPEHVRSACDAFIKHNSEDIMSMLQLAVEDDELTAALEAVAQEADEQTPSQNTGGADQGAQQSPAVNQQEVFKKFWEEKGKYCGACLTMTKKLQKWLSLNCTQNVIADRVVRMCGTMPPDLKAQCESNRIWMQEYVLKQLFNKFPLPNHCAYIGLCEKTMVIRALQNPLVMADAQNALIEDLEGTNPNAVQENQPVLQRAHETTNTAPEITFDLTDGGVSYRDVDRSSGEGLPKVFMDGSHEPTDLRGDAFSLLETEESASQGGFDLSNPTEPRVLVHAQEEDNVNVPIMHVDLKEKGATKASKTYKFQENHLPIETKWLKGCAACQFTIGALFEFMSNPRAIKSLLPSVKRSCQSCNSAEEIVKCEEFVENHGVAFYQDVVRQGSPSKWCPRLELCEIQYFYPSPHVLADTYGRVKDKITAVSDF